MEQDKLNYKGPIILVVMDGVGINERTEGNAVIQSHTEFLDKIGSEYPTISLHASGEHVGTLPGDMGNSEVGHNALGTGQIIKQGIAQIEEAFETGKIWESEAWRGAIENIKKNNSTLHFSGIFSDGNVHANINHLKKMIQRASEEGIDRIRIHSVFDGRDVPPQSEPKYINELEDFFKNFPDKDFKIASGGGRMVMISDRYENDWGMVEKGWNAIVHGEAEHKFHSANEAIEKLRQEDPSVQDQYLPPFVIIDEGNQPVGMAKDGDSFIYYDFRADRAIEIAMAFTYEDFPYFDRKTENNRRPNIFFAGMTEYNSDTHVPEHQLVPPIKITNPLNVFLGNHHITQYAISETVKFGHITYYFNGNSYDTVDGEVHKEIKSVSSPFDQTPWMSANEITDNVLENIEKFKFIRINYANGDMVGHFAELEPGIMAVETVDLQLQRLAKKVDELGGMLLITADHGNVEELLDEDNKPKTSHTTNKVPCIFYDNTENRNKYFIKSFEDAGISNIAPTIACLLGFDEDELPETWRQPLIKLTK